MGEEQAVDWVRAMKAAPLWHEALMAEHATMQSRLRAVLDNDDHDEEAV